MEGRWRRLQDKGAGEEGRAGKSHPAIAMQGALDWSIYIFANSLSKQGKYRITLVHTIFIHCTGEEEAGNRCQEGRGKEDGR
jgi:hypothetical protein